MIYLDSAATTFQKPPAVGRAMTEATGLYAVRRAGAGIRWPCGRRTPPSGCRTELAELFRPGRARSRWPLPLNATHALNIAIKSLVPPGGRVVISGYEHNAVTRPLTALGAKVSGGRRTAVRSGGSNPRPLTELIAPGADAVICNHVSNVFGFVQPVEEHRGALPRAGGCR